MRPGLEGVIAAETVLSYADPQSGRQWVRGHALAELAARFGYEGTVALLWEGFAGDDLTRTSAQTMLGAGRQAAFAMLERWLPGAALCPLDQAVRMALAALPDESEPAVILGTLSVGVPAWLRHTAGLDPLAPDPSLTTAADLLRTVRGAPVDAARVAALDTYFTVMADSGLSTSSFAGRTIASTRAPLTSAVLGAWCAFTGPLHGGAPGPTLDLLSALAATDDMDGWIERKLRAGERLMGFGHRVYSGNDPRAEAMRAALRAIDSAADRLAFAATVEARVAAVVARLKPGLRLPGNVELMAALLLDIVGIPREAFTAIFAVSRCPGWIAHALEQQRTGRMIRPTSRYVGPPLGEG
jgi:citrate synthase